MQQQHLKNRLVTVDALRGFALLGIMLAHFIYWYTAGSLPQEVYTKYKDVGSQVAQIFNELFITGKFFTFFSFLFGLSFYLQMRGLENNPRTFIARYAWRLVLLMVIGVSPRHVARRYSIHLCTTGFYIANASKIEKQMDAGIGDIAGC